MQPDPSFKQALTVSYRLLSYRPRSVHEVTVKLKEKGYHGATVENVIGHLKQIGCLDDAGFAKFWVEMRMRSKPVGPFFLKKDLENKGLPEELVERAIKEKGIHYDEREVALRIAKKRLDFYGRIHKVRAKKRIHDFLVRRGFSFDIIREVLEKLF
jgi:regulatory protein